MTNFINKEKIFANATKLTNILLECNNYEEFNDKLINSDINYEQNKTYEIAPSGFIDFNQHLYEDINHMNSISSGIYLEKGFVTYRIFIWTSRGEGFEIFKHVLRGSEIESLNDTNDLKEYIFVNLNELEQGIVKTYSDDVKEAFEKFGEGIENRKLPLPSILSLMSTENNIKDLI